MFSIRELITVGSGLTKVLQNGKIYNPWLAYGQSKTANILFGVSLTAKLKGKRISSFAVHPGRKSETKSSADLPSL